MSNMIQIKPVLAALLLVGIVLSYGLGPATLLPNASGLTSTCVSSSSAAFLPLYTQVETTASVTELLYFATLHPPLDGSNGPPLDGSNADEIRAAVNGQDALVHDLDCYATDDGVDVSTHSDTMTPSVLVRSYDSVGVEVAESGCASSFSDLSIPDGTQYVAVVPCDGLPDSRQPGVPVPYTVWVGVSLA